MPDLAKNSTSRPLARGMRMPAENIAAKRERLGTALHELATDLARERRRNAELERENRRLRKLVERSSATTA